MEQESITDRYQLVEELSSGGMGTVWRGYDDVLDREVAVKLIRPDVIATPEHAEEFVRRFRREAKVTARIRHHGVPQVFDAVLDRSAERVFLVMELVDGTSLTSFVDPRRPLPISWAVAVAAQICTVLSHAHALPVVHRDLKPDNLLVSEDGMVTVLDFGIAAVLDDDVTRLTATGTPIGTSHYMSPEQIQGTGVGPGSDLYALGCILHELLAAQPVYDGRTDFARMQQHVQDLPQPLREIRADVPAALERLVLDLLAKTPECRPADALEVYDRLAPFLPQGGSGLETETIDGLPDPTQPYRRPHAPRARLSAPAPAVAAVDLMFFDPRLRAEIDSAVDESGRMLVEDEYTAAADLLESAINSVNAVLGDDDPRVLYLRSRRAAALFLADRVRNALTEFDALVAAYARTSGANSRAGLDCLHQAAHCRAHLGHYAAARRQFAQVLDSVRTRDGDASGTALDLRRSIGLMLQSEGRTMDAGSVLAALHSDLLIVHGAAHEDTVEISNILNQLRL